MADADFLLRVRGARESRIFRFSGAEAAELHRLRANGTLERPGGSHRLQELIAGREPDRAAGSTAADVHFEMVAEDELRQYLSSRVMERRAGREAGPSSAQGTPETRPNDPSPA